MRRKLTTEEFIARSREVHGYKYDYSKTVYVDSFTKVCIICPEHGEFWQLPSNHMNGVKCIKCAGRQRSNTEEFIAKARKIHGDKYDYSKVEYVNSKTPVTIICPEHGEFKQLPSMHLNGRGCKICAIKRIVAPRVIPFETFIETATKRYGGKYDYSKVQYKNATTKVCIVCPEHGEFWQLPYHHMMGHKCPVCAGKNKTTENFIAEARKIHGDKYDYSKVEYKNATSKVCIICPEHGEFWQTPAMHLTGRGCLECGGCKRLTNEKFIERARKVHGDKYDYSKVQYVRNIRKVCIICPKHGEFWQTPVSHMRGCGCPECTEKKNKKV